MKNTLHLKTTGLTVALSFVACFGFTTAAGAIAKPTAAATNAQLKTIKADGDAQIAKRLVSLNKGVAKVNSLKGVSDTNKQALIAQLTHSSSGLSALKTTLDADTTVAKAKSDRNLIYTDYRIYMLVLPKIHLIKVADDQITTETGIALAGTFLQAYLANNSQYATLSPKLTDMVNKVTAAHTLSQNVEDTVLALQPSDYNANHKVFATSLANLNKAQILNKAAYAEGNAVVKALKAQK